MTHRRVLLLCCLWAVLLLSALQEGSGASVGSRQAAPEEAQRGVKQKIFMQEADASNFLKKRTKRSSKSREEANEQEEQRREAVEQWRQWHYDGLYPPYLYNRHHI
ncbi:unique cartilage matrix-associated protein isoform X3 [Ochotona curzoniae]|uniref:unique cartilage matrix-associated protein isoform X3 n=1 Tax=Ochotona curzoniae TaxID=130825 RepID=UPI001B34B190|nr:unique cartilage matrix-associated protein isoform X3 [Ochotona curzoniae]